MITDGLVFNWKGGTKDWSRYHATIVNTNAIPVRGLSREGMYFNGVNAFLNVGNPPQLNIRKDITIEAVVNRAATQGAAPRVVASAGWRFGLNYWEVKPVVGITINFSVPANEWSHIVGVKYGTTEAAYINGELYATNASPATMDELTIDGVAIGRLYTGVQYFRGTISSVRIYNRALSPYEIWSRYNAMKPYIPLSEVPISLL